VFENGGGKLSLLTVPENASAKCRAYRLNVTPGPDLRTSSLWTPLWFAVTRERRARRALDHDPERDIVVRAHAVQREVRADAHDDIASRPRQPLRRLDADNIRKIED
jgi:hypothetical protein